MMPCPNCSRDSLRAVEGTRHLACEACSTFLFHEGNGYVVETP